MRKKTPKYIASTRQEHVELIETYNRLSKNFTIQGDFERIIMACNKNSYRPRIIIQQDITQDKKIFIEGENSFKLDLSHPGIYSIIINKKPCEIVATRDDAKSLWNLCCLDQ